LAQHVSPQTPSVNALDFPTLVALTGNRLGKLDVACPLCGPDRRTPINQKRKVLRIWHDQPDFITYHCERCGVNGYGHDRKSSAHIDRTRLLRLVKQAEARQVAHTRQRRKVARWLWEGAEPIEGTLAERYLRSRGITCPLPATLRFRHARAPHPPAMLAAFGIPAERAPGCLDVGRMMIHGVHVTYLKSDGTGKAPDGEGRGKLMIGPSMSLPIVLAPVSDGGGLAIAEGIEDALSLHQATGLGAWAAGCANRLPALARAVPQYVTSVTLSVDDDKAGRRYAHELAGELAKLRGRRLEIIMLESRMRAAA
jgi:hypothetical protein